MLKRLAFILPLALLACQPNAHRQAIQPPLVEKKLERQDQPQEAVSFFQRKRLPAGQSVLDYTRYADAMEQVRTLPVYSSVLGRYVVPGSRAALQGWTFLGPGNVGGRTRALLIDPINTNVLYAGAVSGGVWKSVDQGASWQPLDDLMANLAVASLAMDPTDNLTLYAGTGEGFFNLDAVRGAGVFKTTDGGATWSQLASTANNADFYYVNDIKISPLDRSRIYAATNTGLFRSTDGGATWTAILSTDTTGTYTRLSRCTQLQLRTDQPTDDVLFASCYSTDGVRNDHMIWRTLAAQAATPAWEVVHAPAGMDRASMALAPSNQDVIYVLASHDGSSETNYAYGLQAVYRSTDGGDTWTTQVDYNNNLSLINGISLNTMLLTNPVVALCWNDGLLNQGWYDNVIAVDPVNSDRVWAGGIDLMVSDDGGQSWGIASYWWLDPRDGGYQSASPHADQHAIVFDPGYDGTSNTTMYVANDGGIYRATDATAAPGTTQSEVCPATYGDIAFIENFLWVDLNNNYGVTQFYHGRAYPDGSRYFAGAQDNGTQLGDDVNGPNGWQRIRGGDGGYVAINPDVDGRGTMRLFSSYTRFSLEYFDDDGVSWNAPATPPDTALDTGFLFIAPYAMDGANPDILWTGGTYAWRSLDAGKTWAQASADGGVSISAWGMTDVDSNVVLAGRVDGTVMRNTAALVADATTTWPTTTLEAGCYISSIRFQPGSSQMAYATSSTFGCGHVFRSTDGGQSWTDTSNNLPDIPAHDLLVHPYDNDMLYLATDLGIFVSLDGGASWAQENTGFANVVVESMDLRIVNGEPILYAFTHGRSAWKVTLNRPPYITDPDATDDGQTTVTMSEDGTPTAFSLALSASDPDGDPLTWSIGTPAANGTASVDAGGNVSYSPDADYNGSDSFTVQVSDGSLTDTLTVNVNVEPVNDPPSFTPGGSVTVLSSDGGYSATWATNISAGPPDESNQTLSFQLSNDNNALFSTQPAMDATGVLTFVTEGTQAGDATVTVVLSDGSLVTPAETFVISVLDPDLVFKDSMENP